MTSPPHFLSQYESGTADPCDQLLVWGFSTSDQALPTAQSSFEVSSALLRFRLEWWNNGGSTGSLESGGQGLHVSSRDIPSLAFSNNGHVIDYEADGAWRQDYTLVAINGGASGTASFKFAVYGGAVVSGGASVLVNFNETPEFELTGSGASEPFAPDQVRVVTLSYSTIFTNREHDAPLKVWGVRGVSPVTGGSSVPVLGNESHFQLRRYAGHVKKGQ